MSDVPPPLSIAVTARPWTEQPLRIRAEELAGELGLPLTSSADEAGAALLLVVEAEGVGLLALTGDEAIRGGNPVRSELLHLDLASGPGRSLQQPVLKAIGLKKGNPHRPTVLDLTAGLGEDAWMFAAHGCSVLAVERSPVVFALLRDGLARAGVTQAEATGRITLRHASAADVLGDLHAAGPDIRPEVVYLDPMFPGKRKTAERKPMRMLRLAVGCDEDADALLGPARDIAGKRVVVKRPSKAPHLAGRTPDVVHRGKSLRFDVYLP